MRIAGRGQGRRWRGLAGGLLLLAASGTASAARPVVHEVSGAEAMAAGTLEGLALDADGVLRPGPVFEALPLDAQTAWAAARSGDALWIGTGNQAALIRVPDAGEPRRMDLGEGFLVTAVAALPAGAVAAAVFPGARVVRVDPEGAVSTLATLPAAHVWGLVPDGRGGVLAATGSPGALFAIDAFGATTRLAEAGDEHARCLARRGEEILLGTAPSGRVLAVSEGSVRVLRDLAEQEVVGIVPLADGDLLVAANADQAGGHAQSIAQLLQQTTAPPETRPGQPPPPRAALQDGRILWIEPSGATTVLWQEDKRAVLALAPDGEGAVAGTHPSGRVVRVVPGGPHALLADLPESEASVVLGGPDGPAAIVTSNPAVLHRPATGPVERRWASAPLDAGATARWGRVRVSGSGLSAVAFRAGETRTPDATWSPWAPLVGFDGAAGGTGVVARFLQVRVSVEGANAEVRAVDAVAAAPNRAPAIRAFTATRTGADAPEPTPSAAWTVSWTAEDPDGDRLLVSVHVRREGSARWTALLEEQVRAEPKVAWDTAGLPDGRYVLRLLVSDAPDTPSGEARTATRYTAPLRVDNTAPRVTLAARAEDGRLLVEGVATDPDGGRIRTVRASLDGGPWHVLAAQDGLLDGAEERFRGSLPLPAPGEHDVVVRAEDAEGNAGAAATVFTAP